MAGVVILEIMADYVLPFQIKQVLSTARQHKQRVVLVTGVFDILHQEHYRFLQKAKKEGEVLLVALETDERVRALKGPSRPINSEQERVINLKKIGLANGVFLLPEDFYDAEDHRDFIRLIKPDILAVSSHSPFINKKQQILQELGGEVRIVHQHNPEISSSKIIEEQALS